MKKQLYTLISMIFLISSCQKEQDPSSKEILSGQDIFKAVMFASGNAAKKVPSYRESLKVFEGYAKTNPQAYAEYQTFIDEITKEIADTSPNFFEDFKKHITSDNFFEVDQALKGAFQTLQYTGLHSKKYSYVFTKSQEIREDLEKNIDLSKIDPNSAEGKKIINDYINKKYTEDMELHKDAPNARGLCLVAYAVVAVVVWEVGGAINVVTLINVHNAVFVHMLIYGEVDVKISEKTRQGTGMRSNEYQNLVAEIAENF